jgi:hypothetical protein
MPKEKAKRQYSAFFFPYLAHLLFLNIQRYTSGNKVRGTRMAMYSTLHGVSVFLDHSRYIDLHT